MQSIYTPEYCCIYMLRCSAVQCSAVAVAVAVAVAQRQRQHEYVQTRHDADEQSSNVRRCAHVPPLLTTSVYCNSS